MAVKADQRDKLERLCRFITRPAIAEQRLSLTNQGKVCYELKSPYRDGTTHVIIEPVDFIAKLATLVPGPRVNRTRFHNEPDYLPALCFQKIVPAPLRTTYC